MGLEIKILKNLIKWDIQQLCRLVSQIESGKQKKLQKDIRRFIKKKKNLKWDCFIFIKTNLIYRGKGWKTY